MGEVMATWARLVVTRLAPIFKQLHDTMWAAYEEAGKPYGGALDGLMRWAQEVGKAQRLEEEAEYIRSHHATLALIRQRAGGSGSS
jgi:hypothetical protein